MDVGERTIFWSREVVGIGEEEDRLKRDVMKLWNRIRFFEVSFELRIRWGNVGLVE